MIFWHRLPVSPRMLLAQASYFADYQTESLQDILNVAYGRFRAFCRERKISCSQPPFTVKLVAGCHLIYWQLFSLFHTVPCFLAPSWVQWISSFCTQLLRYSRPKSKAWWLPKPIVDASSLNGFLTSWFWQRMVAWGGMRKFDWLAWQWCSTSTPVAVGHAVLKLIQNPFLPGLWPMIQWGMHWLDSLGSWKGAAGIWCSAMSAGHYDPFPIGLEKSAWQHTRKFNAFLLFCRCSGRPHKLIISIGRAWCLPVGIWSSLRCVKGALVWPAVCFARILSIGFSIEIFGRLEKHFFVIRPKLHALCLLALVFPCRFAHLFHPRNSMSNQAWIQALGHLLKQIRETSTLEKKSAGIIDQKNWMSKLPCNNVLNLPLRNLANYLALRN